MRYLTVILASLSFNSYANEPIIPSELFFENQAAGEIVLTLKKCGNDTVGESFPYYGYATEKVGNKFITHHACWVMPSIESAPKIPGTSIIPVVNMYFETGEKVTFPVDLFNRRPLDTEPTL